MKKNKISSYLLAISVMTFITIFVIIIASSYDNLMRSINTAQSNPLGKNIDLDLKVGVIDSIESRKWKIEKYPPSWVQYYC